MRQVHPGVWIIDDRPCAKPAPGPAPRACGAAATSLVEELLAANGITVESTAPGRYYTTCPDCSHRRKKKNAKCLGVTIDGKGARWGCNHCGWAGPEKGARNGRGGAPLITYEYQDSDGAVVYRKVRNAPGCSPRFWLERPDSDGKWIKGRGNVSTVIYHLPEIRKAMKTGRRIVTAEGEKDVENLWSIGIAATCNPDGASEPNKKAKWHRKFSEMLRGADLVIMGDDDAAGRAHMQATANASNGLAKRVRVLDPACWRPGKDVSDWLANGGTAEALNALLDEAPDWHAAEPTAPEPEKADDADQKIAEVNQSYALVIVGDKTAVMRTDATEGVKFLSVDAFKQWLGNQYVWHNDKPITLAKYWMAHAERRQYEGLVFAPQREVPGHFNLWRGFAVEPKAGDCSKFLAHLKDNVCRRDEQLYAWVVGWFADIVQHPTKKCGTSLVLRGKQGVGKTKVGEVFGSLLGSHYKLVADPRYITGRFNSHMLTLLMLHADEGFWAGDHTAEGKLKDLITGGRHPVEFKGKEPIWVDNFVRLLVTGNPEWMVPAGFEERRFAVLDIGDECMQDSEYFAAIDAEMDNGGREALMHHLLQFDLSTVNLRVIPKTTALLEQKIASLLSEKAWWLDVLWRGELPWGCEEICRCPSSRLFDQYVRHAGKTGVRRKVIETQIGMFLAKTASAIRRKGGYKVLTKHGMVYEPGRVYEFPSLPECRAAFAKMMHQEFKWPDSEQDEWTQQPPPLPSDDE
jgi:Family of unknown function (DUF5906)